MGYGKREKNPKTSSEADSEHFFYYNQGNRQPLKRDWLEENVYKSVGRDWVLALWASSFEPSRDYRL
jgi:hypothetical protein